MWTSRSPTRFRGRATLSDDVRIYAVGDIHGSASLLKKLLLQIEMDDQRHPARRSIIVCLGDYLDRGPDSRLTIDLLMECSNRREIIFLKGNHETFVPRFLDDPATLDEWRLCGGLETLVSYGLTPSINPNRSDRERLAIELDRRMPAAHRDFIESLDLSFCCGDFYFVHAGIRPEIPLVKQREEDLLWIRDEFLSWERPFEKFIVHGHTPVNSLDARSNRINIDTGAFATGRLTCIAIEGSSIVPLVDLRSWHPGADTRATSDMYGLRIALAAAL